MKNVRHFCWFAPVLLLLTLFLTSCKTDEEIGFEVQPPEDKIIVGFNDNAGITAYSIAEDSVRSDETLYNLLGSSFDPVYGSTSCGFYVQLRLKDNNVNFGANPVIDSVVLTLAYAGFYGDQDIPQRVKVYEVSQNFYKDSNYYSNDNFTCYPTLYADQLFTPRTRDSVTVDGTTLAPHLRIRLDNALGQRFLNESGTANLADNTGFLSFFKGLYVVTDPMMVKAAILYMTIMTEPAGLKLYYHNDDVDTLTYTFGINENSARVNSYNHYGFSGGNHDFQQQIAGDTIRGNEVLYLQGMSGVKTFIRLPDLNPYLPTGGVVVNKAQLIIPVAPGDNATFAYPTQLTLVKIKSDNTLDFLPDEFYGTSYFGGAYDATAGEYRFNIATYVQNHILNEGYRGRGLYLAISGASVKGERVVLNGPANPGNKLRLEITYTRIH